MTDSLDIEPASDAPEDDGLDVLRHHVPVDSDEALTPAEVPQPRLEMPDPAPEGEEAVGSPEDATAEPPAVVAAAPDAGDSAAEPKSELQQAYDCLQIRTPIQELQTFAAARLETLVRLGDADRAEATAAALELSLNALREVMGAVRKAGRL